MAEITDRFRRALGARSTSAALGLVPELADYAEGLEACNRELAEEVERLRGMVWWLATELATDDVGQGGDPDTWIELAHKYRSTAGGATWVKNVVDRLGQS